ncbi:hypothetical protein [Telluria beijingensis]|uniref:hypothetical protein n=1 Tax=Telluria beijingensis TaxID=3068633 RepID=UPI002795B8DB|nr:hypothetical protein [Massilia sp. REN29]
MLMLSASAMAADRYERAVTGEWRLTAALDGAEVTSIDEKEASQLIGKRFEITKDAVRFGTRECGPSDFAAQQVEPDMFLRKEFHASADKLRLPNPVTVVDLSCTTVFIKRPNRLVIAWDGWFFDAVRVKSGSPHSSTAMSK